MVKARHAVRAEYLLETVDWPAVQSLAFVGLLLDMQPCLAVLNGIGDKINGAARHSPCERVAYDWQFALLVSDLRGIEETVVEDAAIDAERAEHAAEC